LSRNALIVSSNVGYLQGANALLNSLDYYGNKDLDVHLIYGYSLEKYCEYAKDKFDFNFTGYCIKDWLETDYPDPYLGFCKYKYALKIKDDYDAICHIDADCIVTDNIMNHFKIVRNTDLFLCSRFSNTVMLFDDLQDKDTDKNHICSHYPLSYYPIFYNPAHYSKFLEYMWNSRSENGTVEHLAVNKAYVELDMLSNIIVLPSSLWISDTYWATDLLTIRIANNKHFVLSPQQDKLQVLHSKYWINMFTRKIPTEDNPILAHNINLALNRWNFLNNEWKSKLEEIRKLDSWYDYTINDQQKS
jgi:hypothetical protein